MSQNTPARKPIRTWSDWEKAVTDGQTTAAEERLVDACQQGIPCTLGDGTRPTAPSDDRTIGADLLRYLIIGGCDGSKLHESGVALAGAYIAEELNLMHCRAHAATVLIACHFAKKIEAQQAQFELLSFSGSKCGSLNAQGAKVKGSVFLSNGFTAKGEVSFASAQIGGQLACIDSTFANTEGHALLAQVAQIAGDVFLSNGFSAKGEVSLSGAQIGGQLECDNSTFANTKGDALNAEGVEVKGHVLFRNNFTAKGKVNLSAARIGGQLECCGGTFENAEGHALTAQGARMGEFYWRNIKFISGKINLTGARTDGMNDDAASWDMADDLYLDGFEYTSIHGPLDAPMRLKWLTKACAYDRSFSPQPYEQLAHVLKKMGRTGTARTIQLHKEDKTAQDWKARSLARRAELHAICNDPLEAAQRHEAQGELNRLWFELRFIPLWHWLLKWLVGFGYAPQRAVWWAFGTIVVSGLFYQYVWSFGGIVPNSDVILTSASWSAALAASPAHPAAYFLKQEVGQHYEAYFAFAHAADIFIPLIDFGQESAWTATTATKLGALGWAAAWGIKTFGWIVTALGAAAITGIIRRE